MDLNECWTKLTAAAKEMLDLNKPWTEELHGDGSLVYDYKLTAIINEAKSDLVHLAVKQILAKHDIHNVTVNEEILKNLIWKVEGFSTATIEETIRQPYITEADTEAYRQLMNAARRIIPYKEFDQKATVPDLVKGKRLLLHIHWSYDWIDQSYYAYLQAFQVLLKAHKENIPLSKCTLGYPSIGQVIERFRDSTHPFNQVRGYIYNVGDLEAFRLYKNGHLDLTFKKEADAETAAKILLGVYEAPWQKVA